MDRSRSEAQCDEEAAEESKREEGSYSVFAVDVDVNLEQGEPKRQSFGLPIARNQIDTSGEMVDAFKTKM